jgi:hypothetical protein
MLLNFGLISVQRRWLLMNCFGFVDDLKGQLQTHQIVPVEINFTAFVRVELGHLGTAVVVTAPKGNLSFLADWLPRAQGNPEVKKDPFVQGIAEENVRSFDVVMHNPRSMQAA